MQFLHELFGQGKDLDILQMSCRSVVVFLIAFVLIRISGRRSFGIHTPLDNIITIALGSVLSRAIVGASAFFPVIAGCTVIVVMHRLLGWVIVNSPKTGRFIEGNKMVLFSDNKFVHKNMEGAQVCEEDIMQGVRKSALTDNLDKIDRIYIERNGEITAIKKD